MLSALAAVAACSRLGVPAVEIQQALEEFTGVSRDFESRGSYRGVTLVDDAGGDPAAVGERSAPGTAGLWRPAALGGLTARAGVLDPEAQGRYAGALALADQVVLVPKRYRPTAVAREAPAHWRRHWRRPGFGPAAWPVSTTRSWNWTGISNPATCW